MSKKAKGKKTELDWADDQKTSDAVAVGRLADRAAEALAGLMDDSSSGLDFAEKAAIGESENPLTISVDEVDVEEVDGARTDAMSMHQETLPPADTEDLALVFDEENEQLNFTAEGTELEGFESAQIEVHETLGEEQIVSIVESLLFATDRPQSVAMLKTAFKGTNVRAADLRRALDQLQIEYAGARRGVYLEEVAGGFQLRTKADNMNFLRQTVKARPFKVSGPALEVLAIVAYKQPATKHQIDEIRGVESGHLLRALMEKNLVHFAGKSELPGKPMFYGTTRKFLEIFGLRNLEELPSIAEIDQLIPEGIGDEEEKETLDDITDHMAQEAGVTYSEGEDELLKIAADLEQVHTTTEFFEQEKARMKAERERERAQDLREALSVGENISESDQRWLLRYEREAQSPAAPTPAPTPELSS